jgi:hypothetical protein
MELKWQLGIEHLANKLNPKHPKTSLRRRHSNANETMKKMFNFISHEGKQINSGISSHLSYIGYH